MHPFGVMIGPKMCTISLRLSRGMKRKMDLGMIQRMSGGGAPIKSERRRKSRLGFMMAFSASSCFGLGRLRLHGQHTSL